jgi:hypothetical protein
VCSAWLVLVVAPTACGGGGDARHPDGMAEALCGSPTACNDDAAMSTAAGTCFVADAAPPYSYCECAEGFSQNPKTGLCRPGSICAAATADQWPFRMTFDASDCASRVLTRCATSIASPGTPAASALDGVMSQDCNLPDFLTMRIELTDGCPTVFEARGISPSMFSPADMAFLSCFAPRLTTLRFDCLQGRDCVMDEHDTLAP